MHRNFANCVVVALGLMAVGCSETRERALPAAPVYHTVTGISSGCDFSHLKTLAKFFTNSAQRQRVGSLITQMRQAGKYTDGARDRGFDIMAEIAIAVHNVQVGQPARGSDLTNHLILCMFDPGISDTNDLTGAAAYPQNFPEDFTTPVNPSLHGAYEVPDLSTSDSVLSRPFSSAFSGIAPKSGFTWSQTTNGQRILVYGQPVAGEPQTYDWKVVPRNVTFNPPVIVGLCDVSPQDMLHQENTGLLPFVDATFLPTTCSSSAFLGTGASPLMLASGLARWAIGLVSPRALWANALNPGGLGGSTGGIKGDKFGPVQITIDLTFQTQPGDTTLNSPVPTSPPGDVIKVREVSTGGEVVPTAVITLAAVDNNGATVSLTCPALPGSVCSDTADALTGVAQFGNPVLNKTGAYRFVASASVPGRGIPANPVTSLKFNIRP